MTPADHTPATPHPTKPADPPSTSPAADAEPAVIAPIDETVLPEDAGNHATPPARAEGTKPLSPPEWNRRAILIVALAVYVIVMLAILWVIVHQADPTTQLSWLLAGVTSILGPILGFYFAKEA